MPDSNTSTILVKGTALLNPGTKDATWGLMKDYTEGNESNKEEIPDGDGDTVSVLYTNVRKKFSATFTPLAAAQSTDPPKMAAEDLIGSKISLPKPDGTVMEFLVDSSEFSGTQGGAPSFKIEGYKYRKISMA